PTGCRRGWSDRRSRATGNASFDRERLRFAAVLRTAAEELFPQGDGTSNITGPVPFGKQFLNGRLLSGARALHGFIRSHPSAPPLDRRRRTPGGDGGAAVRLDHPGPARPAVRARRG